MTRILIGAFLGAMALIIPSVASQLASVTPSQAQGVAPERKLEDLILSGTQTTRLLGLVRGSQLTVIHPEQRARKDFGLTTIGATEGRLPEAARLDLSPYEGRLIMVEGVAHGRWLYEAKVIDQASPIMIAVISELFGGARLRRLQ